MRARSILRFAWTHALALALAASATAVIIDSGDGTGNTTAPVPDDPGWSNVGTIGGLTGVYLGGKFVLTANHVGPGTIYLAGTPHVYVPGTAVQLDNGEPPPDTTYADLVMFQVYPEPPLPALAIASVAPLVTTPVIMVGNGRNRGLATTWDPPGPQGPYDGYEWGLGTAKRWGTNTVEGLPFLLPFPPSNPNTFTMAFASDFDGPGPTQSAHECQASVGDSGGPTFASTGSGWELAGVMFVIGLFQDQPGSTALYDNETYSVDLSSYRDQILDVMAMPEPSGGLWPAAALVAMLARRRQSFPRSSTRR